MRNNQSNRNLMRNQSDKGPFLERNRPSGPGIQTLEVNGAREMHASIVKARGPPIQRVTIPNTATTIAASSTLSSFSSSIRPNSMYSTNTTTTSVKTSSSMQKKIRHKCNSINNPACCHCGSVIIPSPMARMPLDDSPSITVDDKWTISCKKYPILNAQEIQKWEMESILPLPEMIFGNNKINIKFFEEGKDNGVEIDFNAMDALRTVSLQDTGIRVSYAKKWQDNKKKGQQADKQDDLSNIQKQYDWTYTPIDYKGLVKFSKENTHSFTLDNDYQLPIDKLSRPDPILFYDDMVLYEDELADNGISVLSAKIRVMNERLLLLCRFFLRVDEVLFRVHDTRIYIEFDEKVVVREYKEFECDYATVLSKYLGTKDPKLALRDSNAVIQHLPLIKRECETLRL
ncbi:related to Type 2A phosphatase activator TIP41 [Saccharomycodes ludwigii]|uniref:Related to Type 2A phosphatase activator TIP41 n=1 Tax=Saccharomycodes ludwigii TaxID=36035 RepID=A0A376B9G2_9ASCO|nr:hypothetical protein SCDLUD_000108 [Saccharomycodes ludwigii]KAH3902529.1 hypothetical protein SCDLUD_000108 [Saccharomycodes ludwigii]SSD61174.1 related to Type 2A phosphatase activator TIP41 [Saccharomycodes ludwigii]